MHGLILQAFSKKELKKLLQILIELKKHVKKAEVLAQKREDELAGSRKEAKTIIENAKETAEKSKASILADAKLEAGRLKEKQTKKLLKTKLKLYKALRVR